MSRNEFEKQKLCDSNYNEDEQYPKDIYFPNCPQRHSQRVSYPSQGEYPIYPIMNGQDRPSKNTNL